MSRFFTWAMMLALSFGLTACSSMKSDKEGKEEEENETKIKFAEAPAAVQMTLKQQAKGAPIDTVIMDTEKGKTTYEAEDVMIDGKKRDIEVAADGKLIKIDGADSEEEKNGGHEDKDDDEHEAHENAAKK